MWEGITGKDAFEQHLAEGDTRQHRSIYFQLPGLVTNVFDEEEEGKYQTDCNRRDFDERTRIDHW